MHGIAEFDIKPLQYCNRTLSSQPWYYLVDCGTKYLQAARFSDLDLSKWSLERLFTAGFPSKVIFVIATSCYCWGGCCCIWHVHYNSILERIRIEGIGEGNIVGPLFPLPICELLSWQTVVTSLNCTFAIVPLSRHACIRYVRVMVFVKFNEFGELHFLLCFRYLFCPLAFQ